MTLNKRPFFAGCTPPALSRKFFISMWVVAIIAGLVQSIAERFYIEPDGVNYLDIAYAYLRHDFHNAVNGYWSPLYSWLMALAIVVTHTPAYWESTVLHSLNFLIYLLSLVCFAFFFRELTMLTSEQHGLAGRPMSPSAASSPSDTLQKPSCSPFLSSFCSAAHLLQGTGEGLRPAQP